MARKKLGYLGSHGSIHKNSKALEKNKGKKDDVGWILVVSFIFAFLLIIISSILQ